MKREISVYLDLMRIGAALAVFFGHAYHFTDGRFSVFPGLAGEAVAIFFVLSGFVITYVTANGERRLSQYAVARMARLFSVAIPTIIATLLSDRIGTHFSHALYDGMPYFNPDSSISDVLRYLSFTNEIWNSHVIIGTDEPYWSLGFEVSYYLIFGVYTLLPLSLAARLFAAAVLLVAAGPKIAMYFGLWLLGVASYRVVDYLGRDLEPRRLGRWLAFYLATPILCVCLKLAYRKIGFDALPMYMSFEASREMLISVSYFYVIGILFSANIVAFSVISRAPLVIAIVKRAAKPVRWFAGATFTMYLAHQPILIAAVSVAAGHQTKLSAYVAVAATLTFVFLLAEVSERRKQFWRTLFDKTFGLQPRHRAS